MDFIIDSMTFGSRYYSRIPSMQDQVVILLAAIEDLDYLRMKDALIKWQELPSLSAAYDDICRNRQLYLTIL